eukprot:7825544-Alexandrium_andersonii.AAC.1
MTARKLAKWASNGQQGRRGLGRQAQWRAHGYNKWAKDMVACPKQCARARAELRGPVCLFKCGRPHA